MVERFTGRLDDTAGWLDLEGILVRQEHSLDWPLILGELRPLMQLKDDHGSEQRLLATRDRLAGG